MPILQGALRQARTGQPSKISITPHSRHFWPPATTRDYARLRASVPMARGPGAEAHGPGPGARGPRPPVRRLLEANPPHTTPSLAKAKGVVPSPPHTTPMVSMPILGET